jgi:hypothetical protein
MADAVVDCFLKDAHDSTVQGLDCLLKDAHSSTVQGSEKFLHRIQSVLKKGKGAHLNTILTALSPADQRIIYRSRIKHILNTCINNRHFEYLKLENERARIQTDNTNELHNTRITFYDYVKDPLAETQADPKKFSWMLDEFTKLVLGCLKDPGFCNKKELIRALRIEEEEITLASEEEQRRLLKRGLASGILATAAVGLVAIQGTTCIVLSLPVVLLTGSAYLVLISEVGFSDALGSTEKWSENLFKNIKEMGLANIFIGIQSAHMIVTTHPFPFMENFLKTAKQALPFSDISKEMIAIAGITFTPSLYFLNQYTQSRKNTSMMDKLFKNKEFISESEKIMSSVTINF